MFHHLTKFRRFSNLDVFQFDPTSLITDLPVTMALLSNAPDMDVRYRFSQKEVFAFVYRLDSI